MYAGGISYKFIEQSKPDFKEFTFDAKKIANETYEELINNPDRTTEDVIEERLLHNGIILSDNELLNVIEKLHYIDMMAVSYYREKTVKTLVDAGFKVTLYGTGWEVCDWIDNENLDYRGRVSADKIVDMIQVRLDLDVVVIVLEQDHELYVPGMEEEQRRVYAISCVLGDKFQKKVIESIEHTDMSEILRMTQTYIQNNVTDSVQLFTKLEGEQELPSVVCLPIRNQEERLGTLFVGKNKENAFMDSRAFYENIASQISIGVANAHLYAKMNDLAIRDGLTRIYNRRHLTELLGKYLSEAMAKKVPVSLALFDSDKYKLVNDTYGHQCGDEVIRYVASLLNRGALKHGGIAGRYGGEEFVVAFFEKDLDETYHIVEDIHNQIRSEEVVYEGKHISVRASVGVASYPQTCANP